MKRFPLWLTIVPLVLAVGGYWWAWNGWKDDFRAQLAQVLPGVPVTIGGFPYRLEATLDAPRLTGKGDVAASAAASRVVLNRGPWQRDLTIARSVEPRVDLRIPALAASGLAIDAPSAETSLHVDDGRIARLSIVYDKARITAALIGVPLTADTMEIHIRETPGRLSEPWSPTLPERAQVVLAGQGVRAGTGAPLTLAGDLSITGPARLASYKAWAGQGSVLIKALTLADKTGEVFRLDATLVASGGTPRLAGTILTNCPLSVRAALTGGRVSEQRLRLPVKLSLAGSPGAWQLGAMPAAGRAVRAQQPPCPVLR